MRLENRVAVITGATSGFGLAVARRFAGEGASLVLNGRRADHGNRIVDELRAAGTRASFVAGDIADEVTATSLAERARDEYGRIDVLVLNAGIGRPGVGPFWEIPAEDFDKLFATNVRGVWLSGRAAVPLMTRGGSIVVMASISSYMVGPDEALYSATKGAVLQLARGMAGDLAERGIRVNALCPGVCDTPLTRWFIDNAEDPPALEAEYAALAPMGRMGTADEIALATVHLASDESSYTTGASLVCDGGLLIR